jgi:phosphatidylglycerol lysyltransferase
MSVSKDDLFPYLQQYGSHCMAYSSLEPQMEYFMVDGVGYIAYIPYEHWLWAWKERKIVLADPVCALDKYSEIISAFIKKYPNVIFVQSSKNTASVLNELGYQVNLFGVENKILLADFSLEGKQRAKLRQWKNKCVREGVTVEESCIDDCNNIEEIKSLSDAWLKNKGGNGLSFLVRPFRAEKEKDVRYFWAYQNNKLIGMALFDPIYRDGKVIGYYHNIDRIVDEAPHGTSATILLNAINIFLQEGVKVVSLGMSPMFVPNGLKNEFNYHPFTRKAFRYAYEKLNFLYSFKGNLSHKKKFGVQQEPIYISSTNGTGLGEVFVMMKAIGMV